MITLLKATVTVLDGRATTVLVTPNTNTCRALCKRERSGQVSVCERERVLQTFWRSLRKFGYVCTHVSFQKYVQNYVSSWVK